MFDGFDSVRARTPARDRDDGSALARTVAIEAIADRQTLRSVTAHGCTRRSTIVGRNDGHSLTRTPCAAPGRSWTVARRLATYVDLYVRRKRDHAAVLARATPRSGDLFAPASDSHSPDPTTTARNSEWAKSDTVTVAHAGRQ